MDDELSTCHKNVIDNVFFPDQAFWKNTFTTDCYTVIVMRKC